MVIAYTSKGKVSDGGKLLILSDFYTNKTLAVPQNIKAAAVTSVTISFDKVAGASSYDIYFSGTVYTVTASTAVISKVINSLKPQTNYNYAVRAKNVNRTGAYSASMTVTTAPGVPQGITAKSAQGAFTEYEPFLQGAGEKCGRCEFLFTGEKDKDGLALPCFRQGRIHQQFCHRELESCERGYRL